MNNMSHLGNLSKVIEVSANLAVQIVLLTL